LVSSHRDNALEARLRRVEDELEIMRLLASYGPAVDSGSSEAAARLWLEDGTYDVGGRHRANGRSEIAALYEGSQHQDLIHQGSGHVTTIPRITVDGDRADAVGYSFVLLRTTDGHQVWRASANHWTLRRTGSGWRIELRHNRVLDGSEESHSVLRQGVS
jgi:hypothetical protein